MIGDDDLRAGVAAGIVTEAQAARLLTLSQSRAGTRAALIIDRTAARETPGSVDLAKELDGTLAVRRARPGGGSGTALQDMLAAIASRAAGFLTKRFDGRQSSNPSSKPQLIVTFTPAAPNPADINGDGAVNGLDLTALLGAWGTGTASADIDGSGIVDGFDLSQLLAAWTG